MISQDSKASKSKLRRIAASAVRILLAAYLGILIFLYLFQSHYIYRPTREIIITPDKVRLDYESVALEASDGTSLAAWFVPAANSKNVVLFLHSNMGNMSHYLETMQTFQAYGLNVMVFDYRGFGQSGGRPSEDGTYLDAEAAWDYLVNAKKFSPGEIVICGRSLGGSIASRLARDHTPAALIIESAFTSFPDLAADYYPYLPVRIISKFNYPTLENIRHVNCPVLVVHSRQDEIVPFEHGQKIFEAANKPKQFLEITGNHNDGFLASGDRYNKVLKNFIKGNLASGHKDN